MLSQSVMTISDILEWIQMFFFVENGTDIKFLSKKLKYKQNSRIKSVDVQK